MRDLHSIAASNGEASSVDVLVWTEAGARWYGGDDAIERYREDPEASVFERIEEREARRAVKERQEAAARFARAEAAEKRREARREARIIAHGVAPEGETLEEAARRRAKTIRVGPTGLRRGFYEALAQRAEERGRELEINPRKRKR